MPPAAPRLRGSRTRPSRRGQHRQGRDPPAAQAADQAVCADTGTCHGATRRTWRPPADGGGDGDDRHLHRRPRAWRHLALTWVADHLAHVLDDSRAEEAVGTWTGRSCPDHGLQIGTDGRAQRRAGAAALALSPHAVGRAAYRSGEDPPGTRQRGGFAPPGAAARDPALPAARARAPAPGRGPRRTVRGRRGNRGAPAGADVHAFLAAPAAWVLTRLAALVAACCRHARHRPPASCQHCPIGETVAAAWPIRPTVDLRPTSSRPTRRPGRPGTVTDRSSRWPRHHRYFRPLCSGRSIHRGVIRHSRQDE